MLVSAVTTDEHRAIPASVGRKLAGSQHEVSDEGVGLRIWRHPSIWMVRQHFLNKRSLSLGTGLHAYVFVNKSDVAERLLRKTARIDSDGRRWLNADVYMFQKRYEFAQMRSARGGTSFMLIRSHSKRGLPAILATVSDRLQSRVSAGTELTVP